MGQHRCSYKVGDWGKYNNCLRDRYDLEVWFPPSVVERWYHKPRQNKHGAQLTYSRTAILICHQLRALFNLSLRGTQGFLDSFFKRLQLPICCPHYSQLSRRAKDLRNIPLPRKASAPLFALVDSTGLKVYGQGEWHVKMYKASKRRTWRKLHLVIDPISQEIIQDLMTVSRAHDSPAFVKIIPKLPKSIQNLWGDGAYDTEPLYKALHKRGIKPIIPPQRNGRPSCYYRRTQQHLKSLKKAFQESVDDYLETCAGQDITPEKPFKGTFNVRVGEKLHRKVMEYAWAHNTNLNTITKEALSEYLATHSV